MKANVTEIVRLFGVNACKISPVPAHEGGRNKIYVLENESGQKYVLRLSTLGDRTQEAYLAETDFVRFLAEHGAAVANVVPSVNGNPVERVDNGFACLFEYAPGMLISDNGYRYRSGAPLAEYFYNTGKTLGKIHALSKTYVPTHRRSAYFDKYNMDYLHRLIPDAYGDLKRAVSSRLDAFHSLPMDNQSYGLVHFDFSDGNYHIDMNTGNITVFDFDNAIYCWYMFDLANLWIHGTGWCQFETEREIRRRYMQSYFDEIIRGYKTETNVSDEMLHQLPLFIDMVLIENIVDEFECCARQQKLPNDDDIAQAADCLTHDIPYAGFC